MRVFVSSVISGMEEIRAAAREAVTTLRHEPIMAEEFSAQPHSPQVACLTELRNSDLVVLILGEHYGAVQSSGLSATHEEYREAREKKPVIAFVQQVVNRDPEESELVREVQRWEGGLFRGEFTSSSELRVSLTRALHDHDLANAVGPFDQHELVQRATSLLPADSRGNSSDTAILNFALVGGPRQSILRPVEIEDPLLADALHERALFGKRRLFDHSLGVQRGTEGDALVISQANHSRIALDEQGSVVITLPLQNTGNMMSELIEELVQEQISQALGFATWSLDRIDPTQRLTHIVIAISIINAGYMNWRTQRESDANPDYLSHTRRDKHPAVHVSRRRAALRLDAAHIVEDLLVPLRRQWK